MANAKIRGITVEIGGDTTKLGKALQSSETSTRSLQGELRQVEKLLQLDPSNVDLIAQRQRILTQAVEETSEKLRILEKAEQQVIDQFNRGDIGEDQLRAFQREIIETQNKLSKFEGDLDGTGDALQDVGNSAEKSSDGFTIMKGALADIVANVITSAISSIGDLVGSILELSEATEEYRTMQAKLAGSAETFGYSTEFATSKYEEFYKYLGDDQMATNAITNLMGIGTNTESVSKLAEGATAVWASYGDSIPIESLTESINETVTVGKVTGTMADTINWAKDANENLNKALGGNKKAQKAYNDAIKEGLPVEDAFNEALAKITDEQERADVVAQFLNSTYGESKSTYDELNKSVLDANEAELALKDTQAQLGEAVAPVNTAITNLKNQALQAILPLVEKVANAFLDMYEYLQKNPAVMKAVTAVVIALATGFTILAGALAIQGLITGVTKAIAFLNTTLLANPIVLIIALIAGLVAGFIYLWNNCDAFRNFWINLWEKIKSVASDVKDILVEFFTVTIPNAWDKFKTKSGEVITAVVNWFKKLPGKMYDAISSAIAKVTKWGNQVKTKMTNAVKNTVSAVIKWFKQLPGKIWSAIVSAVSKVAQWGSQVKNKAVSAISSMVSSVVNWAKQLPGRIWSAIVGAVTKVATWGSQITSRAVNAIKNMVSKVFSTAKQLPSKIWNAIKGAITKVTSWGKQMISKAKSAMSNMVKSIVSTVKELPSKIQNIAGDIVTGLWNGIKNKTSWLKKKIKSFVGDVTDWLKNMFGIESPSTLMRDEIGRYISEGIGVGIEQNKDKPLDALSTLGDEMVNTEAMLNGATINRKLATTFNAEVANAGVNDGIIAKLDGIYERLNRMQIVLDTGTLVGETIDRIDASLANKQILSARGV